MALSRWEAVRLSTRALLLQVLLNYRTMQGCGYLYTLWPWLRRSQAEPRNVRAAGNYLNAHPVFASLAIGALRRRIEAGDAERDPQQFAEWQSSLCGPLGLLGDQLIWDRWKPLLFSVGVLCMLWWPNLAVWAVVAAGTLMLYSVPLFFFRVWGVQEGYRLGADVLTTLQRPFFAKARRILTRAGVVVAGLLLAAGLARTGAGETVYAGQFLMAFVTALLGLRLRWTIIPILLMSIGTAVLLPAAIRLLGVPG